MTITLLRSPPSAPKGAGLVDITTTIDLVIQGQPVAEQVPCVLSVNDEGESGYLVISIRFEKVDPTLPAAEINRDHPTWRLWRWDVRHIESCLQIAAEDE